MSTVVTAIENFRDAAMFPANWPRALDTLAQVMQSDGATLVFKATTESSIAVSRSIAPFVPLYMSNSIKDPREQRVHPTLSQSFMPDHAYFSSQEIAREPYYQDFLVPNGFGWNATANLQGDLMVSLKRGFKRGAYEGTELQQLNAALPWLRSISRMACLTWRSHFSGQLCAFERLNRGALLLDTKGRVLEMNRCVKLQDGLDVVDGFLQATATAAGDRVRKFVAAVIAKPSPTASSLSPPSLAVPRPSGARPWLLDGISCSDALRSLHSRAAGLIVITDLAHRSSPRAQALHDVFGLTPTERALAIALVQGKTLQQAATALSISQEHARQRLKALFHKTRTSRQSDLINLLSKLE